MAQTPEIFLHVRQACDITNSYWVANDVVLGEVNGSSDCFVTGSLTGIEV